MRSIALSVLLLGSPVSALAQDHPEARLILEEAQSHAAEGRHAMAAQRFLALHAVMRQARHPRASIALWSAGLSLSELAGREQEAITTLRQFLSESTTLTGDAEVQGWRSTAVSLIAELEARRPTRESLGAPDASSANSIPASEGSISPVGPVILGVGGAALLVGGVIGGISLGMSSDINTECPGTVCPSALQPQYDEMRAFSAAADGLLVAGGVTAALGLILTLALTEGADGTGVSAFCGLQGCRGVVRGSF